MDLKGFAVPPESQYPILIDLALALVYDLKPMNPLKLSFPLGTLELEFAARSLSLMSDRKLYAAPSEHQLAVVATARRIPGIKIGQHIISMGDKLYRRLSHSDLATKSGTLRKVQNERLLWYVISDPILNKPETHDLVLRFIGANFKDLGRNLRKL